MFKHAVHVRNVLGITLILLLLIGSVGVIAQDTYGEAPMLAEMVAAGTLPPVAERLPIPEDIFVVEPVDGVGQYGGTWHDASWADDIPNIKMELYDPPIRWLPDYSGYGPGLAKSWEWSEDGTSVTYHFRQGVKWSDGEEFNMDDLRFWWEDLALNEEFDVVAVPWWGFKSDGTPMDVTFPDEYTMTMTWDKAQWITPFILAQGFWEWEPMMTPEHYLKTVHPAYTDGATYEDLELKFDWEKNPEYPTLFAWHTVEYTPAERTVLERNPYYWKTDTEGNQLPYIDRLEIAVIPDAQVRLLEVAQGKYEASFRATDDPNNIPFLLEQAEANNFHLHEGAVNGAGGWPGWLIDQDFADTSFEDWEEIRMVLRDARFRRALSHAMDRQRIIHVAWGGFGVAQQATISPQSPHFLGDEGQAVFNEWANAYVEFNPELAGSLLDEVGMADSDGDGCRELPSGAKFDLIMDLGDWGGVSVATQSTEAYSAMLNDVGLCTIINNLIGQPDWTTRQNNGLYMIRNMHASELDIWTYPDWIFPVRNNRAFPLQGRYRETGGAEGEQPLEGSPAQRLQAIYDQGVSEPDSAARDRLVWDAVRIHIDEGPFMIGASGDQAMPVVVSNTFHGIPELVILGPWAPGSPGNLFPEQFWMDQS
jgi:peptide/nickel transport system substrate-binding protein